MSGTRELSDAQFALHARAVRGDPDPIRGRRVHTMVIDDPIGPGVWSTVEGKTLTGNRSDLQLRLLVILAPRSRIVSRPRGSDAEILTLPDGRSVFTPDAYGDYLVEVPHDPPDDGYLGRAVLTCFDPVVPF